MLSADEMEPALFCAYVSFALIELGADGLFALNFVGLNPEKATVRQTARESPAVVAHLLFDELAK